ncbi:hypothetical protein OIU84_021458 [Salix udensis]|uniref:CRAL-TRIO domain-containing protein n=1 Tax=Salix udensis TaxID=889485 RepID=A0AAD6KV75_9ROSI|nr:hypothetical protein OIU84_021458 [Salix udensis]
MGKKEHHQQQQQQRQKDHKDNDRVEAVLGLLRKQATLTVKQEKFCSNACVERFLRAKGDNVKKAAKHLRACLSWRESTGTENLIADEFSVELAEGVAYVAGHDEESRPVMIFRIKQDYQKLHSQKLSASAFMNLLLASLKIVAEYYPGRLYRAFVIDPPSLFSCLWKGVRPFVELSSATMVVSSVDFEESLEFNDFSSYPRASSLRFDPSSIKSAARTGIVLFIKIFLHCVPPSRLAQALALKSYSFASPLARTPRGSINGCSYTKAAQKTLFPSTPLPQRVTANDPIKISLPRTPRPSFLQSPALFFRKECHVSKADRSRESFVPFFKFYRRPYDEMVYRSKMRPPLGGLISIVSPHIRRRHVSVSQRF